jgi:hypothetical protein
MRRCLTKILYRITGQGPEARLDPTWNPLRDHPRFQALLEK